MPGSPVDIETTLEAALRKWHQDYRVTRILIDPYQAYRSLATLTAAHVPVEECNQTPAMLHKMASTLCDLITQRRLVLYDDRRRPRASLNAAVVESERGLRLGQADGGAQD